MNIRLPHWFGFIHAAKPSPDRCVRPCAPAGTPRPAPPSRTATTPRRRSSGPWGSGRRAPRAEGVSTPGRPAPRQENSAYNGHFESTCYHPLLLFNREGDCLAAKLRPGNVHSADDWEELLLPEIERQQKLGKEVVFRADAAFAKPEIYEALEERGVKYAIRIPSNENLERDTFACVPHRGTADAASGTPKP